MPLQQIIHRNPRHHQTSTNEGHFSIAERRHFEQHLPPGGQAASSSSRWSDHVEEKEQDGSFVEISHRQSSFDCYAEEDVIISDENGEYKYGVQEVQDFTHHDDDVLAAENNDEVASSVHFNGHHETEDCYDDEKEQAYDYDGYPLDNYDEEGYEDHGDNEVGSMHDDYYAQNNPDAEEEEMDSNEYYLHHDAGITTDQLNEEQYHPFDIGDLHQLPHPPSLDFELDDNRYEADDECHFDDDDFGQEDQDGDDDAQSQDEYEASDLPQLSAESLDVVHRIEVLMERIFAMLDKMEAPQITGYKGSSSSNDDEDDAFSDDDARDIIVSNLNENGDQNFCRAWSNIGQCRTFTSICLVLSFIHQLLLSMRTTTTREVYYVFVTHFRSQSECDRTILDVAKVLGVSRRSLGLSASPKGWFCGCVEITRRGTLPSGKDVSGTIDGTALSSIQGLPITREWIERDEEGRNEQGVEISVSSKDAKCILVIEKEGVFNRLSEERLYDRFPCIMVTGKGFPDLCTRALVKTLHEELDLPVLGLCDMNPYGISVLSVYFCAGDRMGVDGNYRYSVPIEWMGLRPTCFKELHEKHRLPNTVFQALTDLDRKRMDSLTDEMSPYLDEDEKDEVAEEMKYKVEIESLYWLGADFLGDWVLNKLQSRFE